MIQTYKNLKHGKAFLNHTKLVKAILIDFGDIL